MKRLLIVAFVFCLVCMVAFWTAWISEPAVRYGFRTAARWLPGDLKAASIKGSLSKTILIEDLTYSDGEIRIGLKTGELDIGYFDWTAAQWTLNRLYLKGLLVTLPGAEESEFQPLPDFAFPVSFKVRDFLLETFSYTTLPSQVPFRIDRLQFSAQARDKTVQILSFDVKNKGIFMQAAGEVSTMGHYPFELDIEWVKEGGDIGSIRGYGGISGNLEQISIAQEIEPPLKMKIQAEVFSPMSELFWQAKLSLDRLDTEQLKLTGASLFVSGDIHGRGDTKYANLQGKYQLQSKAFGKYKGALDASWKDDSLMLRTLDIASETGGSRMQLKGLLGELDSGGKYSLQGEWQDLQWPPKGKAEWYSRKGRLNADGTFVEHKFSIDGDALGKAVSVIGALNKKDDLIDIPAVAFRSESTAMQLSGSVGEKIDLRWDVTSNKIAEWLPAATGKVQSYGRITGHRDRPMISTSSKGQNINYQEWQIEELSLQGEVGAGPSDPMNVNLNARGVLIDGETLNVVAKSQGTRTAHRIDAKIASNRRKLVLAAQGGVQKDTWAGVLYEASYGDTKIGDWRLKQPGGIVVGKNHGSVEQLCWTQKAAALCGNGSWQAKTGWDSALSLVGLPLSIVAAATDEKLTVTGQLDGVAQLKGTHEKITWGDIQFASTSGVVQLAGEDPVPVEFGPATLQATISEHHSDLAVRLSDKTRQFTPVKGKLSIPGTLRFSALKQLPVQGRLDLELSDFSLLPLLVPQISKPIGQIRGAATISGHIGQPTLDGGATLSSASVGLPDLGIRLSDLAVNVEYQNGNELVVDAKGVSGGGPLSLDGRIFHDASTGWNADFHMSGDKFIAMRLPEAYLKVSPELDLAVKGKVMDLTGSVFIPEARLEGKDQTQIIRPSEDVIIVPKQPSAADESRWKINSRIKLSLGDAINVMGFGFTGRVTGTVDIEDRPKRIALATGEVRIQQGEYSIYGQTLAIEEGRLNYSKSPVNNPAINIRAVRKSDNMPKDTLVGVDLTGTLDKPKAALFSTPPMTESDRFAYLITGSPLSDMDSEQGDLLNEAATSLGLAGGNQLLGLLGDNVGFFDELKLKSTSKIEQTALFLGKYLTPDLFVEYGVGLLDAGNVVRLNYKIHKNWELESETGKETSADILFTVDF